jgi:hypothetical protein
LTPRRPSSPGGGQPRFRPKSDLSRWARRFAAGQVVSEDAWREGGRPAGDCGVTALRRAATERAGPPRTQATRCRRHPAPPHGCSDCLRARFSPCSVAGPDRVQPPTASVATGSPARQGERAPRRRRRCRAQALRMGPATWKGGPLAVWWPPSCWAAFKDGCAPMLDRRVAARCTGLPRGASAGTCGASPAPPRRWAAPSRFGWLEGARRPLGRGGRSAARKKRAGRMQGRSAARIQLPARMRAPARTDRSDTGRAHAGKH